MFQHSRPRRLRRSDAIRAMVEENNVSASDLIAPLFFIEGTSQKVAIDSMPGQSRFSVDLLVDEVLKLQDLGVKTVALFPAIEESLKTKDAKEAHNEKGLNQRAVRAVKEKAPEMTIMTDVALDPYSSDGHDGLVDPNTGEILNDPTLEVLCKMALAQARAGSDIVGPSDMMDGRVGAIREALDAEGFTNVLIMSYPAKYASHFYGPFRDALDSAPKAGDKKTYQMNYANRREALKELELDINEGADIVMVKPGLSYLDIISDLKQHCHLPVAAYNVSGEYAMVKAAQEKGWLDGEMIMVETLTSFKRAGADIILTYFAQEMAKFLKNH
ncbi:MAG: porphobilinogen synthase [Halobacteriovoraceae bacterium]|nr:porphobilinogen synthase [Halobacteriovoraceae bacterium]